MVRSLKPYRRIAHTADLGMVVRGEDLTDLFTKAAWSFFDLMVETQHIDLVKERAIVVEAPDREALLVAWLGELLYLFEVHRLVFGQFSIRSLTPTSLQASVWGEFYDLEKHRLKTAIKAVTYHQIHIWKKKGGWRARIIFDL